MEVTVASPLSISDNAEACVNIWPFSFFSETQHLWPWFVEQLSQSQENQISGINAVKNKYVGFHLFSHSPVVHILGLFLCVLLEHRNTHPNACKAFVSHGKCVGLESQCSDLFSTHEGGVYSISMVIKPDWKACRHTCVFVCVWMCILRTHWWKAELALPPFILLRWKEVVLIICCMHMHKPAHTVHTQGNFFLHTQSYRLTAFLLTSQRFTRFSRNGQ